MLNISIWLIIPHFVENLANFPIKRISYGNLPIHKGLFHFWRQMLRWSKEFMHQFLKFENLVKISNLWFLLDSTLWLKIIISQQHLKRYILKPHSVIPIPDYLPAYEFSLEFLLCHCMQLGSLHQFVMKFGLTISKTHFTTL